MYLVFNPQSYNNNKNEQIYPRTHFHRSCLSFDPRSQRRKRLSRNSKNSSPNTERPTLQFKNTWQDSRSSETHGEHHGEKKDTSECSEERELAVSTPMLPLLSSNKHIQYIIISILYIH